MEAVLKNCTLCPRRCGADRYKRKGACGSGALIRAARAALHYGEEPCISGTEGSGTVFFSGCTLNCVFCQNHEISHLGNGADITPERLAEIFGELEAQGANNINLVTPTQWSLHIKKALEIRRPGIPVLYNCSGYESVETLKLLEGYIDVWLPDIKYADALLGEKFSGVKDYPETAFAAVGEMLRQCGNAAFDEKGRMTRGVMIRHLVLPLHLKNTYAVLDEIAERFGTDVYMSLMFQYTPMRKLERFPELNRELTKRERQKAENYFHEKGFHHGYIQETDSSGTSFIPVFDLTGIRSQEG